MSDRAIVASRKGLFTIRRKGANAWAIEQVDFLADNVVMALVDPRDQSWYAVLKHGHFGAKIHRSHDGGSSWQEVAVPEYPPKPEGEVDLDPWKNAPVVWRLEHVWALEPGHASEPGVLWCGTLPGGLFQSRDGGNSWELNRPLWDHPERKQWFGGGMDFPGIHSICVDPHDARTVTVGVSCGGVWRTRDGGSSWECKADGMWAAYMPPERKNDPRIQDPHRVVQCAAKPDCFWSQHHNGVFRTTNACESWQGIANVPPAVFGFAVAVHPRDPETAWLIPATKDEKRIPVEGKVVVSRTRDGGKTFEVLRHGLPQEHAYDLVFRHALDIDETGTRLAFGSTTGNLWVSEDQGDSWSAVSHHLPPIYQVRFID